MSQRSGFSLVELSIVLVILGLLTGGILGGQSLIRASELRAVTTEYQRYLTAMGSFRDKYFAIPGDFAKASDFGWGSYNGDGDGVIENSAATGTNEIATYWAHLASAGLLEGSYTPPTNGGIALTPGTNNPRSKISGAGWNIAGLGSMSIAGVSTPGTGATAPATSTFFSGNYGNALLFGGGTSALLPTGVLKPEEAWNLDVKMDDSKPDQGLILTLESQGAASGTTRCTDQASADTALAASNFVLANSSATACSLVFKTNF